MVFFKKFSEKMNFLKILVKKMNFLKILVKKNEFFKNFSDETKLEFNAKKS
jgi:hypothetical protein